VQNDNECGVELSEKREFMRAIIRGVEDVEAGRTCSVAEAKNRLGIG